MSLVFVMSCLYILYMPGLNIRVLIFVNFCEDGIWIMTQKCGVDMWIGVGTKVEFELHLHGEITVVINIYQWILNLNP